MPAKSACDSSQPEQREQSLPHFTYQPSQYKKIKTIGYGTHGCAILVQRLSDCKHFVLKKVTVENMDSTACADALNEVRVLSQLHHPNIIAYHESFLQNGFLNIVMDYANEGDLHRRIQQQHHTGKYFSERQVMHWFLQILLALHHVHNHNILHRDLKTQNIFLMDNGVIKLGDFGISKTLKTQNELTSTQVGTPNYLSPELCDNKPYNAKSDVWALGCVLYELCCLKPAFDGSHLPAVMIKILKGKYGQLPPCYRTDVQQLVRDMLQKDPSLRPSVADVLSKRFCQKYISELGFVSPLSSPVPSSSASSSSQQQQQQQQQQRPQQQDYILSDSPPRHHGHPIMDAQQQDFRNERATVVNNSAVTDSRRWMLQKEAEMRLLSQRLEAGRQGSEAKTVVAPGRAMDSSNLSLSDSSHLQDSGSFSGNSAKLNDRERRLLQRELYMKKRQQEEGHNHIHSHEGSASHRSPSTVISTNRDRDRDRERGDDSRSRNSVQTNKTQRSSSWTGRSGHRLSMPQGAMNRERSPHPVHVDRTHSHNAHNNNNNNPITPASSPPGPLRTSKGEDGLGSKPRSRGELLEEKREKGQVRARQREETRELMAKHKQELKKMKAKVKIDHSAAFDGKAKDFDVVVYYGSNSQQEREGVKDPANVKCIEKIVFNNSPDPLDPATPNPGKAPATPSGRSEASEIRSPPQEKTGSLHERVVPAARQEERERERSVPLQTRQEERYNETQAHYDRDDVYPSTPTAGATRHKSSSNRSSTVTTTHQQPQQLQPRPRDSAVSSGSRGSTGAAVAKASASKYALEKQKRDEERKAVIRQQREALRADRRKNRGKSDIQFEILVPSKPPPPPRPDPPSPQLVNVSDEEEPPPLPHPHPHIPPSQFSVNHRERPEYDYQLPLDEQATFTLTAFNNDSFSSTDLPAMDDLGHDSVMETEQPMLQPEPAGLLQRQPANAFVTRSTRNLSPKGATRVPLAQHHHHYSQVTETEFAYTDNRENLTIQLPKHRHQPSPALIYTDISEGEDHSKYSTGITNPELTSVLNIETHPHLPNSRPSLQAGQQPQQQPLIWSQVGPAPRLTPQHQPAQPKPTQAQTTTGHPHEQPAHLHPHSHPHQFITTSDGGESLQPQVHKQPPRKGMPHAHQQQSQYSGIDCTPTTTPPQAPTSQHPQQFQHSTNNYNSMILDDTLPYPQPQLQQVNMSSYQPPSPLNTRLAVPK